ncbi:Uncharacterised protein [Mycobacteroides abscessus subsp. abscessus]|nr:Uncharacterised protein [Mycobacteroides abscessus subsp. abscessus]
MIWCRIGPCKIVQFPDDILEGCVTPVARESIDQPVKVFIVFLAVFFFEQFFKDFIPEELPLCLIGNAEAGIDIDQIIIFPDHFKAE